MGIVDRVRNVFRNGEDNGNENMNKEDNVIVDYVEYDKENVSKELEEKVGRGIRTLLKDEINKYNLTYEVFNIENKGRKENTNQIIYEISFMVYGDKECFDINIEASEVPRADGGTFIISKGTGSIVLVGEWANQLQEKEGYKEERVDIVKEMRKYIQKFRNNTDNNLGVNKEYKGNADNRDRERVVRLAELMTKDFKVKGFRDSVYGEYIVVNVAKGLTLLVTPTLIINTNNKEEVYYKHSINNNLEKGLKKLMKSLGKREECEKLKVFLGHYTKANDLRRKV